MENKSPSEVWVIANSIHVHTLHNIASLLLSVHSRTDIDLEGDESAMMNQHSMSASSIVDSVMRRSYIFEVHVQYMYYVISIDVSNIL